MSDCAWYIKMVFMALNFSSSFQPKSLKTNYISEPVAKRCHIFIGCHLHSTGTAQHWQPNQMHGAPKIPNLSLQQVTKEKEKGDFGGIDPLTVPQLFLKKWFLWVSKNQQKPWDFPVKNLRVPIEWSESWVVIRSYWRLFGNCHELRLRHKTRCHPCTCRHKSWCEKNTTKCRQIQNIVIINPSSSNQSLKSLQLELSKMSAILKQPKIERHSSLNNAHLPTILLLKEQNFIPCLPQLPRNC